MFEGGVESRKWSKIRCCWAYSRSCRNVSSTFTFTVSVDISNISNTHANFKKLKIQNQQFWWWKFTQNFETLPSFFALCTDRIEEDRVDYINFCLDALGISTRHNIVTVSSIENLFNSLINSIKYSSWWPEVSRGWVAESGKSLLSFIQSQFVLIWKLVFAQLFEQSAESEKKIENETDSENERESWGECVLKLRKYFARRWSGEWKKLKRSTENRDQWVHRSFKIEIIFH